MSEARDSKCPARSLPREAAVPELAAAPIGAFVAERLLLLGALERTRQAGDRRAEAAALRCLAAVEDAILSKEEC